MGYAEVCVNSPIAQRRAFSYSIPPGLSIEVGQAVWVPFGDKVLQGIVVELTGHPAVEETRDIQGTIDSRPLVSPERVKLARWISDYYLSPLFDAVALMLPPGFERGTITYLSALPDTGAVQLTGAQSKLLDFIRQHDRVSLTELEKAFGKRKAQAAVSQLVQSGVIRRDYELEPARVKPRREPYLSLLVKNDEAREAAARLRERKAPRQAALLDFLILRSPVPWSEARQALGADRSALNALVSKELVRVEEKEVRREPLSGEVQQTLPLALTGAQALALESVKSGLQSAGGVFLLHGVTGSGKTEVYLQALAAAVRLGRKGIVLVPEIALTPQTIERFASRFPGRVAVFHSQLSLGEQFDEWRRIRDGEFDVVIGSRSALFAPQPDLGLIVIDEEHEWTYKQSDVSPRYHARSAALKLGELTGAVVLLGSATPDIESYYRTRRSEYHLLELRERVTPGEGAPLPDVEVVDLKRELKAGNRSLFSSSLRTAITEALAGGGQVILFLNRRGAASFIQCRTCGFALRCKRCDVPLTYHIDTGNLVCHHCNRREPVPYICPRCQSRRIKFLGVGTQKLEEEARRAFPSARLLRWDSDIIGGRRERHQEILSKFRAHQADILIGTQMVAKGLDFPLVTVVGVVSADIGLNLPDFRAGERTFQLLSQVAGRAGRGASGGRAVVQTYTPEHYAIRAAAKHDYTAFFEQEMTFRRQLRNPPFSQLASLVYLHTSDERCRREAERLKREIAAEADSKGLDISIIGPAPAFAHRLRGRFRWQLILRGSELSVFLSAIALPRGWAVDIDPVGMT